ncbi:hypothetical protein BU16DRAFT_537994 [Lophium mytilinum]|uniref:Uncharacterized protein n=1 Tax=Lophium mytilinum TaxID=390894 RepID=A0A6A6QWM8_9PEZI|nr:hypothetical protein BU16DRAFT_537994 [Lophium mytilinum]
MSSAQGAGSPKPEKSSARRRRGSQSRGSQARHVPGQNLAFGNRGPASAVNRDYGPVPEGYQPASHEDYVRRYLDPNPAASTESHDSGFARQTQEATTIEERVLRLQAEIGSGDPAEGRRHSAISESTNAQQILPRYTNNPLSRSTNDTLSQSTINPSPWTSTLQPYASSLSQTVRQTPSRSSTPQPYSSFLPHSINNPTSQSFSASPPLLKTSTPQPLSFGAANPGPVSVALAVHLTMSAPLAPPGAYSGQFPTAQLARDFATLRNPELRSVLQDGDVVPPEGARHTWCRMIYDAIVKMAGAEPLSTKDWIQGNAPQQFLEALAVEIVHNIILIYTEGPRVFLEYPFNGRVSYFEPNIRLGDRLEAVRAVLARHKDYCLHVCNGSGLQHLVHAPRALMISLDTTARSRFENLHRQRAGYGFNPANPPPVPSFMKPGTSPYQSSSSLAPVPAHQQHRGSYQPAMGSTLLGSSMPQSDFAIDPRLRNRAASTSQFGGRPAPPAPPRPDESIYGKVEEVMARNQLTEPFAAPVPPFGVPGLLNPLHGSMPPPPVPSGPKRPREEVSASGSLLSPGSAAKRARSGAESSSSAAEARAAPAGLAASDLLEMESLGLPGLQGAAPAAGEEEIGGEDWQSFLNDVTFGGGSSEQGE